MTTGPVRLLAAVVVVFVLAVAAVQVGYGPVANPTAAQSVSIERVSESPEAYLGQSVLLRGWYQGGAIRSKNPQCANTREGVRRVPYSLVYVDLPENVTLYTGVKYRFTGTMRSSAELNRTVPQSQPVFVPEAIDRARNQTASCTLPGDETVE